MLKTLALAAAASFALAGGASAQNMMATHGFLMKAGASDSYEIAAAEIAGSRAQSERVKDFARMMALDHAASTARLTAVGEADMGHRMMAPMIMPEGESMLSALRDAPAASFDRTYMAQQVKAHEEALGLMKGYAATGDYPRIKAAAGEIAVTVEAHLKMARAALNDLK